MLMADRTDTNGESHNNGKYAMYLTVSQPGSDRGPNAIKEGENSISFLNLNVGDHITIKGLPKGGGSDLEASEITLNH